MLIERGIPFTVVPGATAFTSALILSGMDASRFAFIGFLPEKKKDAKEVLEKYKDLDMTLIFYSAPHDLKKNLELLYSVFGDRKAATVKEITKMFEKTVRLSLSDYEAVEEPKGEYVIVVEGGKGKLSDFTELSVEEHLSKYLDEGMDKKEAIKLVAKERGIPKNEVYKFTIK